MLDCNNLVGIVVAGNHSFTSSMADSTTLLIIHNTVDLVRSCNRNFDITTLVANIDLKVIAVVSSARASIT